MKARQDNLRLAVTAILFTVFALASGDALIKRISADLVLWQIFVVRSMITLPILAAFIKYRIQNMSLFPTALRWTAIRSVMLTLMWIVYYAALPHVELSVAAAAYYTLPIFIALFASFFIGDRIEAKGWFAVFLGFCGIVLILKPSAGDFNWYALLPIISAVLFALAMIITRTKCINENPFVLSFSLNVTFILVGLVATLFLRLYEPTVSTAEGYAFLIGRWAPMGQTEWLAMVVLAISIIIGSVGAAIAYQAGPPSIVGTFDFAYVGFAAMWGFLVFSEVPDVITLSGLALIVVAGVLAVRS